MQYALPLYNDAENNPSRRVVRGYSLSHVFRRLVAYQYAFD